MAINAGSVGPLNEDLANYTLGGPDELFGDTFDPADVNDSAFTIILKPRLYSGLNASLFIDSVEVTIYTSTGAETQVWTNFVRTEEKFSP